MDTFSIRTKYNEIGEWWVTQMEGSTYGLNALRVASNFVRQGADKIALDVGCGGEGRFLRWLVEAGFRVTGLDISETMIALAKERAPEASFVVSDIVTWSPDASFDLITAWDSTFHLPLAAQEPVLKKLCASLNPKGVLLFTCGGTPEPSEITGSFGGKEFGYSTLGVREWLRLVIECGMELRHFEYDQWPEKHAVVIAQLT